jgi:hypothetical protein
MAVFGDVVLLTVVDTDPCFRESYCLHFQGYDGHICDVSPNRIHGSASQKIATFIDLYLTN